MNFLKTFGASLLAWIVGVILVFVFLIGSLINSIVSSLDTNEGVSSNTILCIDLNENIIDAPISSIFGRRLPTTESSIKGLRIEKLLFTNGIKTVPAS